MYTRSNSPFENVKHSKIFKNLELNVIKTVMKGKIKHWGIVEISRSYCQRFRDGPNVLFQSSKPLS